LKDPIEFFPGDPPWGEYLIKLLVITASLSFAALLLALAANQRGVARKLGVTTLVVLTPIAWFVTERHTGPWKAFQIKLVDFEGKARQALQRCNQNYDCASDYLDTTYGTTTFQFTSNHRPVRLFIRRRGDRLAVVDFGHGANAVFDSTWMLTVYSD